MKKALALLLLVSLLLAGCVTTGKPKPMTPEEARNLSKDSLSSKISALSAKAVPEGTDYGYMVDMDDTSSKKFLFSSLVGNLYQAYDADLSTYGGITPSANVQTLLGSANHATFVSNLGITTSIAELNYVTDVTGLIQAQLNLKAPLASPTFTGTVVLPSNQALLGSPTFVTSILPTVAGAGTIGSVDYEIIGIYLGASGVIYGEANQGNTLTSAATGWVANLDITAATYGGAIPNATLLAMDDGALTEIQVGGGAGVKPVWTTATGSGAPVRATSPTITTPILVTPIQNVLRKDILTSAPTDPILLDEYTVDGVIYDPSGSGLSVSHKVVLTRNTTELMPNTVDRDMSGASAWTDGTAGNAMGSYDETTDLTITANAVGDFVTLIEASAPTTIGKRYRLTYDLANLVGTWTVMDEDAGQTIGTISAEATQGYIDFTATTDGGLRLVSVEANSSGDFDNFTLNLLPYILDMDENGIKYANGISSRTPVTGHAADFAAEFTGADLYGGTFICSEAGTIALPVMVAGMNFTVITLGALAVVVDTNAADGYLHNGVTGTEGKNLTNLSTAGDIAVIQYYTADDWLITTNGWTPE